MSVCQYLAAEVHIPQASIPRKSERPRKTIPIKKTPITTVSHAVQESAPIPIVSQIMEMGFPRKRIEYAIQV